MTIDAAVAVRRIDAVLATTPATLDWMSPGEQARAARLRAPARHAQYVAGHWLLRQLLADVCGGAAADYTLLERDNLPPAVAGSGLRVSLSHGGDWIAAGMSSAPIGIDLEPREPRPALGRLQHLLLNTDEPPDSLDNDALLQRWVLKEALIKRDHGNALPDQLTALQLRPAAVGDATVELLSTDAWHLALAPPVVAIRVDLALRARSAWAHVPG